MVIKTCILVITSINQEIYKHYILSHWKNMLNNNFLIDIYFLLDNDIELINFFKKIGLFNHCIVDSIKKHNYVDKKHTFIPGILSKTIYGYMKLSNKYDVYVRTNLSSFIKLDKLRNYINNNKIIYSGTMCWENSLRSDLIYHNKIGKNKSIKSLDELKEYPGNTFFSGGICRRFNHHWI